MATKIKLTGEALAKEYGSKHPLAEKNPGKVYALYLGGGWIDLRGDGLMPHRKLADQYPNGWSLGQRLRSSEARAELENNFAELRATYADADAD